MTPTSNQTCRRAALASKGSRPSPAVEAQRAKRRRIDELRAELEYGEPLRYADLERVISWGGTRGSR